MPIRVLTESLVKSKKIRGVGIWTLDLDGTSPELWDLLEKTFTNL